MSALTEVEIFDALEDNLKRAIQAADDLTTLDRRGPAYSTLREALGKIEGCCRQASAWREDTRWLGLGLLADQCLKKSGGWLRGHKDDRTGVKITLNIDTKNKMFEMLASNLRLFLKGVETLKDGKTGKIGMILPETPDMGRRIGAPVSNSGLTLPPSMQKRPKHALLH
jgi:hypothetical protein